MQMLMTSPNYIPATRACTWARSWSSSRASASTTLCRALHHTRPARPLLPIPLPIRLLRKQPGMQRGFGWEENTFCKRSALRIQTAILYSDKNSKRT